MLFGISSLQTSKEASYTSGFSDNTSRALPGTNSGTNPGTNSSAPGTNSSTGTLSVGSDQISQGQRNSNSRLENSLREGQSFVLQTEKESSKSVAGVDSFCGSIPVQKADSELQQVHREEYSYTSFVGENDVGNSSCMNTSKLSSPDEDWEKSVQSVRAEPKLRKGVPRSESLSKVSSKEDPKLRKRVSLSESLSKSSSREKSSVNSFKVSDKSSSIRRKVISTQTESPFCLRGGATILTDTGTQAGSSSESLLKRSGTVNKLLNKSVTESKQILCDIELSENLLNKSATVSESLLNKSANVSEFLYKSVSEQMAREIGPRSSASNGGALKSSSSHSLQSSRPSNEVGG